MHIDFTPLRNKELTRSEFYKRFTIDDLRAATNASIDTLLEIVSDLSDEQINFVPNDPLADDEHAPAEQRYMGWTLGHLVLHVTASSEEGAAFSSLLARGITVPYGVRLRYEDDWQTHCRTQQDVIQRLEESRRMRLAYLDTWPDKPHLDVFNDMPEDSAHYGKFNCVILFCEGLRHEDGHYAQFRDAKAQAVAALK